MDPEWWGMSRDRVAKYLEERIRELEKRIRELSEELEILRQIAAELPGIKYGAQVSPEGGEERSVQKERVKVIYVGDEIIANEVATGDGVKIVLRGGLRVDDEIVTNFLIRVLDELKGRKDLTDYRIRESGGYISEIELVNPSHIALKQIEIALKYVWDKVTSD